LLANNLLSTFELCCHIFESKPRNSS